MIAVDQAFKGWHPGEQAVQKLMCLPERVSVAAILNRLPDQHRIFHSTRLHYVPVTTLDDEGRSWASVLCSSQGTPGFIHSPSSTALHIHARVWPGDPIRATLARPDGWKDDRLASGLGLEPSTRRRNKFAGRVSHASFNGDDLTLQLSVSQALGLCPKYIKVRELEPYPDVRPRVVHERWRMEPGTRLPDDVVWFVHQADTAYLATSYVARAEDANLHPSRVGTNHRGGRPGFIRVRPGDGRTLVLPNYNVVVFRQSHDELSGKHPRHAVGRNCFSTGAVLYLTGTAETLFGEPARKLMSRVSAVTTIYVTGFSFVENAMPIRETPDATEDSPYWPPVDYLSEETPPEDRYEDVALSLVRTRVHNNTLATFTFKASRPVQVLPSQNAILDLSNFVRERATGLVDWTPGAWAKSDDCVRTWTVSIPPTPRSPTTFSLTIRLIEHGLITPVLHRLAQSVDPNRDGDAVDVTPLGIVAQLRGIGGTLPVPQPLAACDGGRRLLWIAGGIGLTPFLGLTRYVVPLAQRGYGVWNVVLVASSREPEVTLSLMLEAYWGLEDGGDLGGADQEEDRPPIDLTFSIHLFTDRAPQKLPRLPACVSVVTHRGRISDDGAFFKSVAAREREPHICGPLPFVQNAMKSLAAAGVDPESVLRERFTY